MSEHELQTGKIWNGYMWEDKKPETPAGTVPDTKPETPATVVLDTRTEISADAYYIVKCAREWPESSTRWFDVESPLRGCDERPNFSVSDGFRSLVQVEEYVHLSTVTPPLPRTEL